MKLSRTLGLGLAVSLALASVSFSQTWTALKNQPIFSANDALLLTDGRVIVQATNSSDWWTLTPDDTGSYVKGTWTQVASLQSGYSPLYHAAAILPDGRLVIEGGEFNGNNLQVLTNQGAIYDPVKNEWTPLTPPAGWTQIGDAQSVILKNGTFMLADPVDTDVALLNAKTLEYTVLAGQGKADRNDEEGWTLLPDGEVLTVDAIDAPNSELFNPKTQTWSSAGSTIVSLEDPDSQEIGPMVLQPDGIVFATGAGIHVGHTSNYNTATGEWTAGPDIPDGLDISDGPASLLVNGHVLIMASPGIDNIGVRFFEWTGTEFIDAPNIAGASEMSSFVGDMLVLPTGQVLLTTQGQTFPQVLVYTAKGTFKRAWAPTITSVPTTLTRGTLYVVEGTQFNGLSQGAAYGMIRNPPPTTRWCESRTMRPSTCSTLGRSAQYYGCGDRYAAGVHTFHCVGRDGDRCQHSGRSHKRYPIQRSCGYGAVVETKQLVRLQSIRLVSSRVPEGGRVDFVCFSESPRMGTTLSQRLSETKAI